MRVVVIDPPAPIVLPSQVPGGHDGDDAFVTLMIAAAQADLDGPTGWLGRALGIQTLELQSECWPDLSDLPYPPFVELVSVRYTGADGEEHDWPLDEIAIGATPPSARGENSIRIRYRAGYENAPANAVAAVILMASGMVANVSAEGGLRSFEVQGAFTKQFNSPELVSRVRDTTVQNLLAPLRVYA